MHFLKDTARGGAGVRVRVSVRRPLLVSKKQIFGPSGHGLV